MGSARLLSTGDNRFTLSYTVDGATVTKNIERLTWASNQLGGTYYDGFVGTTSNCFQSFINGYFVLLADMRITQTGSSNRRAFEYTVLIGGSTTRVVTDEGGLRIGDCVAVERGGWSNLRLVDDSNCNARSGSKAPPAAIRQADSCIAAKHKLLQAETKEAFDLAERRVRLLCDD